MNPNLKIIGDRIISKGDLDRLNEEEVKSRNYTHCTIEISDSSEFLAKVSYSEGSKAWEPTEVLFDDVWIPIRKFEEMPGHDIYGCDDYRHGIGEEKR